MAPSAANHRVRGSVGAALGALVGAVPGGVLYLRALVTQAVHQGMVDDYFIAGSVAVLGLVLGAFVGLIVGLATSKPTNHN